MKKYVPRSIQNIFDRVEAFNESITEKLFSEPLPTTFEVIVYAPKNPEVKTPTISSTTDDSSNINNYHYFKARSLSGHHDHLTRPETATTVDQYERFRNAHFQAIIKKAGLSRPPQTGDVWLATETGANLVTLVSFERSLSIKFNFKKDGDAKNAHKVGRDPVGTNADYSKQEFVGPPSPIQFDGVSAASDIVEAYPVVDPQFASKIVEVANNLGTNPYWLANLINFETAGTFSPSIVNSLGYTGLIQFGKGAATDLGTTREHLRSLSAVEQMDFVQKYFELPHKRRGSDYSIPTDLYMAVFYPLGIGNPQYQFPDNVVRANNGINTPAEYARRANNNAKLPTGL